MFLTKPIHMEWQKEERSCGILPAGQMVHADSISCFTWWARCWKKRRRGAACKEMKRVLTLRGGKYTVDCHIHFGITETRTKIGSLQVIMCAYL